MTVCWRLQDGGQPTPLRFEVQFGFRFRGAWTQVHVMLCCRSFLSEQACMAGIVFLCGDTCVSCCAAAGAAGDGRVLGGGGAVLGRSDLLGLLFGRPPVRAPFFTAPSSLHQENYYYYYANAALDLKTIITRMLL
eukprot:COSAG05_NODE_2889_length_2535_cov_68.560755_3_plen_135_part_00